MSLCHLAIVYLHWKRSAGDAKDRHPPEELGEFLGVEGGGSDDDFEVAAAFGDLF